MVSLSVAAVGGRLPRGDLTRCINVDLSFDLSETPSLSTVPMIILAIHRSELEVRPYRMVFAWSRA